LNCVTFRNLVFNGTVTNGSPPPLNPDLSIFVPRAVPHIMDRSIRIRRVHDHDAVLLIQRGEGFRCRHAIDMRLRAEISLLKFILIIAQHLGSRSTKSTQPAPRLKASIPIAPLPENTSSTRDQSSVRFFQHGEYRTPHQVRRRPETRLRDF